MEEQIRGNQQCIDIIDRMLKIGRPLPLPDLPDDVDSDLRGGNYPVDVPRY